MSAPDDLPPTPPAAPDPDAGLLALCGRLEGLAPSQSLPWAWEQLGDGELALGAASDILRGHVLTAFKCSACQESGLPCLWPTDQERDYIAAACNAAPELILAVRRLLAERDALRRELARLKENPHV